MKTEYVSSNDHEIVPFCIQSELYKLRCLLANTSMQTWHHAKAMQSREFVLSPRPPDS